MLIVGERINTSRKAVNEAVKNVMQLNHRRCAEASPGGAQYIDVDAGSGLVKKVKKKPMINSTTAEKGRFDAMKSVFQEKEGKIVALCMDECGIPRSTDQALESAHFLVKNLKQLGVPPGSIHLDPMIQPVSVDNQNGLSAIENIRRIHQKLSGMKTIYGLSNVSFGVPNRVQVNRTFLVLCIGAGLTGRSSIRWIAK